MDRRKFIQNMGRGALLSGLVLTSGYLLFRKGSSDIEKCNYEFICQNCKKSDKCNLPEKNTNQVSD